ncbi:hypothetical protein [Oerskovia turbata]
MIDDQEYTKRLRDHVDALVPTFAVDTTSVVETARRRRAAARTGGGAALAVVLAATAWVVQAQPWDAPAQPASGAPFTPLDEPLPTPTVDPGWPDAPFWHTLSETESTMVGGPDDGETTISREESWKGHDEPGLLMSNGDVTTAAGIGPSGWGSVVIDGEEVLIDWDGLYTLPTDPVVLEQLLRGSLDPERGSGTDEDKLTDAIRGFLAASPAPPALRLALYEVAAGLPGTTVTPGATDAAGRTGVLLERRHPHGHVNRLIIEPGTGRLLEESSTLENPPPAEPGAIYSSSWRATYLDEGPADDTPVEPTLENSGCVSWETC